MIILEIVILHFEETSKYSKLLQLKKFFISRILQGSKADTSMVYHLGHYVLSILVFTLGKPLPAQRWKNEPISGKTPINIKPHKLYIYFHKPK